MTRKEQREAVFQLLFEKDFRSDESAEEVFASSSENRDIDPVKEAYIKDTFFGVIEHEKEIDEFIADASNGWKVSRLSKSTRAILRLCVYEIAFSETVPAPVAINEAVEIAKKFDDPKAKAFINGVLNSVKNKIGKNDEQ